MGLDYPVQKFQFAVATLASHPARINERLSQVATNELSAVSTHTSDIPEKELREEVEAILNDLLDHARLTEGQAVDLAKRIVTARLNLDGLWDDLHPKP